MDVNVGLIDRLIRTIVAIAVILLYLMDIISGPVAIFLGIIAVLFLLTSFLGICPVYNFFGIKTTKK